MSIFSCFKLGSSIRPVIQECLHSSGWDSDRLSCFVVGLQAKEQQHKMQHAKKCISKGHRACPTNQRCCAFG